MRVCVSSVFVHVYDPMPHILTGSASRLWRRTGPCAVNHRFGLTDESAGAALTFTHTLSPSQDHARSLSQPGCLSLLLSLHFLISPVFSFFLSITTCVSTSACCLQFVNAVFYSLSPPLSLFVFQQISSFSPLTDGLLKPLIACCVNNNHIFTFLIFSNERKEQIPVSVNTSCFGHVSG